MFDALRRMIIPIIIIVLFFFVSMIVLQWGLDITGRQRYGVANYAGVINGEKISWDAFQRTYGMLYEEAARDVDEELPESKITELETTAWQQILQDRLISQEAAKHNIAITDDDLYLYLRLNPPTYLLEYSLFQTEGRFDYQKYLGAMADPQWAPFWSSVEPQARDDLRKAKMQQLIIEAAIVTEAEVKQAFLDARETVTVNSVNIGFVRFSQPAPKFTEEELIAYHAQNKDKYQLDERSVLNVAAVDKEPTEEDWEITHSRSMALYDSVMAGADFAVLAKVYSDDINSARNDGDLGWFERGRMVPEFDSLSFSMKEDDVSEPIRTRFGWHILKHFGYKEETKATSGKTKEMKVKMARVSHILLKTKPSQETLDALYARIEQFRLIAVDAGVERASEETGLEIKTTDPFLRNRSIPHVGWSPELSQFAFDNDSGAVSDIMEVDASFVVVQVIRRIPAGPGEFSEVKARVRQNLTNETLTKMCHDTASAIYAEIQKGTELKKAAKMFGGEVESPPAFSRNGFVITTGRDPKAIGTAFSLTEPGQISPPVDYSRGSVIFSLIERNTPDLTEFNEKRDSILTELLTTKQQQLYGRWFNQLVENSQIENNVERQHQLAKGLP